MKINKIFGWIILIPFIIVGVLVSCFIIYGLGSIISGAILGKQLAIYTLTRIVIGFIITGLAILGVNILFDK